MVEGGFPFETAVGELFHAEEGHGEGGEIVVVNACVDEGGGEADLGCISIEIEMLWRISRQGLFTCRM